MKLSWKYQHYLRISSSFQWFGRVGRTQNVVRVVLTLESFDAHRAKRVVVILPENGTHWKRECRLLE
jgi:hypothetical protein